MCLHYKTTEKFKPFKENGHNVGSKSFSSYRFSVIRSYWMGYKDLPRGKWINEKEYRPPYKQPEEDTLRYSFSFARKESYKKGFHIFLSPHEETTKVYYRKVVAQGYEGEKKVIVAQEIFIP